MKVYRVVICGSDQYNGKWYDHYEVHDENGNMVGQFKTDMRAAQQFATNLNNRELQAIKFRQQNSHTKNININKNIKKK